MNVLPFPLQKKLPKQLIEFTIAMEANQTVLIPIRSSNKLFMSCPVFNSGPSDNHKMPVACEGWILLKRLSL